MVGNWYFRSTIRGFGMLDRFIDIKQKVIPIRGALFFYAYLIVMIAYLGVFNNELVGKPVVADFDLIRDSRSVSKNRLLRKGDGDFRVTVYYETKISSLKKKHSLYLKLKEGQREVLVQTLKPRSSEGAGGRSGSVYFSHLNYGLIEIPRDGNYDISITADGKLKQFDVFQARLTKDSGDDILLLLQVVAAVFLFLATYFRQKTFRGSFLRSVIAYSLFAGLGVMPIVLSLL